MTETWHFPPFLELLEWTRLFTSTTAMALLTKAFRLEPFFARAHELAFAAARARCFGSATWTFILTARADEALLAFAFGHAILQEAFALPSTGDFLVLRASGVASSAKIASIAFAAGLPLQQQTAPMAITCYLATCFSTAWAIPVTALSNEPAITCALRLACFVRALAMSIANIVVGILGAWDVTLVTCVSISANTPGLLALRVHEAGAFSRADFSLSHPGTRHPAILAEETFLALADCLALTALLDTAPSFDTTADSAQSIPCALHGTIATPITFSALTLATLSP